MGPLRTKERASDGGHDQRRMLPGRSSRPGLSIREKEMLISKDWTIIASGCWEEGGTQETVQHHGPCWCVPSFSSGLTLLTLAPAGRKGRTPLGGSLWGCPGINIRKSNP